MPPQDLEPVKEKIGIDHIGLTVGRNAGCATIKKCLPDLGPVFSELAGKSAELGHGVQRGIGTAAVIGQGIHEVEVSTVVATEVVVVFEISVVIALIPILGGRQAVDHGTVVQDRQVKATPVPTHKLRNMPLDRTKELPNALRLLRIRGTETISETANTKAIVVSKSTPDGEDALQIMRQKLALSLGCSLGLQMQDRGPIVEPLRGKAKSADPRNIGNRLKIKNKDRGQLAGGQDAEGVDRLASPADLEVEHRLIGIRHAQLGNLLAPFDCLALLDEDAPVVGVGGDEVIWMLHDDQVPVSPKAIATVDHTPLLGRKDRLTLCPGNRNALAATLCESRDDLTICRPSPAQVGERRGRCIWRWNRGGDRKSVV